MIPKKFIVIALVLLVAVILVIVIFRIKSRNDKNALKNRMMFGAANPDDYEPDGSTEVFVDRKDGLNAYNVEGAWYKKYYSDYKYPGDLNFEKTGMIQPVFVPLEITEEFQKKGRLIEVAEVSKPMGFDVYTKGDVNVLVDRTTGDKWLYIGNVGSTFTWIAGGKELTLSV